MKRIVLNLLLIFLLGCSEKHEQNSRIHTIKVVVANGYIVPKDSMAVPKVILVDERKLTKMPVGKPKVMPTNTNVHPSGLPKVVLARMPRICTPGKDTFSLPKTINAIDSPFVAGIPEIVIAKDAFTKEQNPQNFSSFKKLQGLKHNNINYLLEDRSGNLWFGTAGGGVTKYDGKYFTHFTDNEGLSNNDVRCILEDKSGNIWFGTFGGGVSKYNGKTFTHFTKKEGLSNNIVRCIAEDKSGNLWFGTEGGGVSKYDGKTFTHFTEKEGLYSIVLSIIKDKSGNLWFGTYGAGLCKYDGKTFTHFTEKEGLINNYILNLVEDKSGNIWIAIEGGLTKYDGRTFTHFTNKEGMSNNVVMSILEDRSGNLWIGSYDGGVCKYDGKTFTHFTRKEGLSDNVVLSILEDRFGNLWFGTYGGGVCKYDGKTFTHYTDNEGLSNNDTRSILQDNTGNIWFGMYGGGVCKYDGKTFTQFTDKEGLSNNHVMSILEDKSGNIWFGTFGGGVCKFDGKSFTYFTEKEGLSYNDVRCISEDKSGNLWFGTYGGGACKYDGKTLTQFSDKEGLSNNNVRSILQDKFGNIWFATAGGGVCKYDGKSFTHFTEKEGLSNNNVLSMLEDKSGNLWFGTAGGGVNKYNGKSFTHFTEKEGLSNNNVLSMLEDKYGNLWFGTRFGLTKLTLAKSVEINEKLKSNSINESNVFFKSYTYEDGFLGIGCNGNSICEDKSGTIWIGTNDRLTAYHPNVNGEMADMIPPNVQLTSISLFNENISWINLEDKKDSTITLGNGVKVGDFEFDGVSKWNALPENLRLTYNNNYLTFNFIGITMSQPKKVKYKYKLEGIDENWSALTSKTEAPYGNLPNGTYNFKVKAMNSEGYWSESYNYTFTIRPPWWKTWWFRTLIGLVIIASVWYYIKWRERALKERQKELEVKINEATFEIKEQKHLIEEKHKEITDSINYAERIQRSFLATKELLDENLIEYFVLFQPKDIVSGDFYWASKLNNGNFALATADSTGHGVPGAIMSLLNITSLEKAIEDHHQPSDVLNITRKIIIERLRKDGSVEGGKDGMDCSLICFDFSKKKLIVAAANNPVWIVRASIESAAKEVIEIKPDKMPVGKHDRDNISFTQQEVDLQKGDVIYTLTDGFPDQFGGALGKKFMSKNLRELLSKNAHLPMQEQKDILISTFIDWVGNLEQVDDVTIIGVRF